MDLLNYAFMQRALIAAVLVGITAPAIGIYLVQRRQPLMGDGIGHVAMTGVGLGFLLNASPVWMATAVSALGSVLMELIRWYGKTRGDIALAMLFYGGMAGGVMFVNIAPGGSNANLMSYLFGSLSTVAPSDVTAIMILAAFVVAVTLGLRRQLFAVSQDEEFARVTGLPVRALNLLTAVTAAVTVTVAMRVVGLILVSALMVVPVAARSSSPAARRDLRDRRRDRRHRVHRRHGHLVLPGRSARCDDRPADHRSVRRPHRPGHPTGPPTRPRGRRGTARGRPRRVLDSGHARGGRRGRRLTAHSPGWHNGPGRRET